MHGLNPSDNKDIAEFGNILPRKLTNAGCAGLCLDHVPKSAENRGRYAIGGVHKLNGLDGAAYTMEAREPFGTPASPAAPASADRQRSARTATQTRLPPQKRELSTRSPT